MIAKTTTGRSFESALGYGAADLTEHQRQHKQANVVLLDSYNLISDEWSGMAAEMAAVAQGSRCQSPVWHTSLSVSPDEQLTGEQWRAAARQYCQAMGADPAQHQVAIFQHRDRAHPHVHIYINRVRLDAGPALDTSYNYVRNVKATRQLEQHLQLAPLPQQRTSLKDHSKKTQTAREQLAPLLAQVLSQTKPTSLEELESDLAAQGIEMKVALNSRGGYGVSFKQGDSEPVKGSAVGYKYKHLVAQLEANRAEYIAEIERLKHELAQKPATVEIIKPDASHQAEIKQLKEERAEAYEKRNAMQEAFLNQKPVTIIKEVEVVKEVIKSDPADQVQIADWKQRAAGNYAAFLKQKQQADKVPDLTKSVEQLTQLNEALEKAARGQQAQLEQEQALYQNLSQTYQAHIEKYNDLVRRFNEQRARLLAKESGQQPIRDAVRKPVETAGKALPTAGQLPSVASAEPEYYARFRAKIKHSLPAPSPAALAQKLRNTYLAKPHLGMEYKDGELYFVSDKHRASAQQLGFSATLGYAERDLKKLPSLGQGQGI